MHMHLLQRAVVGVRVLTGEPNAQLFAISLRIPQFTNAIVSHAVLVLIGANSLVSE